MNTEFKKYLDKQLLKPTPSHFNANGNSHRAVIMRGRTNEIIHQYKMMPNRLKTEIGCFEGLETPIVWFIQIVFLVILFPILPILAGHHHYNKAVNAYKRDFKNEL
jgi:predicted oxidoreductase (fatty acid repression mutant protein)